jgi:hypothetical protein
MDLKELKRLADTLDDNGKRELKEEARYEQIWVIYKIYYS